MNNNPVTFYVDLDELMYESEESSEEIQLFKEDLSDEMMVDNKNLTIKYKNKLLKMNENQLLKELIKLFKSKKNLIDFMIKMKF